MIKKQLEDLKRWALSDLPRIAAVKTENYIKNNFRLQGYQDGGVKKWAKRKNDDRAGGAILIGKQSGLLRDSIRAVAAGGTITISTDKIYAKIHNEGGTIIQSPSDAQKRFFWAKHYEAKERGNAPLAERFKRMALARTLTITMPQRQFMPIQNKNDIPKELQNDIVRVIEKKLLTIS